MANNISAIPVGKLILAGSRTGNGTIDIKNVCAENGIDYSKLNTSNFVLSVKSIPSKTQEGTDGYVGNAVVKLNSLSPRVSSYSNGVVTISGATQSGEVGISGHEANTSFSLDFTCSVYLFCQG